MGKGRGPVEKEKETEKEQKKRQQEEAKDIVAQIRQLLRQEQGTSGDNPEWKEFENALIGFLNGDVKGNARTLSIKLLDNIQNFAKGKKNFIESAKGQQVVKKLHEEMRKVPGAMQDEQAKPLLTFLAHMAGHAAGGDAGDGKEAEKAKSRRKAAAELEKDGWVVAGSAPKAITVEEGKKEQDEAMEAVRKLHKAMGIKSPEELKKEQQQNKGNTRGMV